MEVTYIKEYSEHLLRDMEYKVYGRSGKLCFAMMSQNGRFYDWEDFGMADLMSPWIESGRMMLVTPDGIDTESWSNVDGDPRHRIEQQERYFNYVTTELYPSVKVRFKVKGKAMVTGCSLGAMHAGIIFFRRPDLFDTVIALSGAYNANMFFGGYQDELTYANSPAVFLRNMPLDHPYMKLYRKSKIIICVGQGSWEDQSLAGTRELDTVMAERGIPAKFDYWGYDVVHDWPWWKKQLKYFLEGLEL